MNISYSRQTIDSLNPIARYAHRNRFRKSIDFVLSKLDAGKVLDYGCGSGLFVSALNELKPGAAIGYEPYMQERAGDDLPVYKHFSDVVALGKYSLVTLFETIEHLSDVDLDHFLTRCEILLSNDGGIIVSAPIEIGPALILKELNRSIFRFKKPEHGFLELIKASFLARPAKRAVDIKSSHKGFDFRRAKLYLERKGWNVHIFHYGPLPIKTWYGNSQVYMWVKKPKEPKGDATLYLPPWRCGIW